MQQRRRLAERRPRVADRRPRPPRRTATPAPTASPTPVPAFPVSLTDDEGTAVKLDAEPQKIVTLTPAATETLFAIGAGDRVVATDDGSDYPAEAAPLPDVATFGTVDVEKIVALDPDLVVAGGLGFTPADSIAKLRSLGVPVLVIYAPSIDGVYKDIELLGDATGQSAEADAITAGMQQDIDAVSTAASAAATASGSKPRVFYDVGYLPDTGQIYGPAKGSFLEEMVSKLGVDVITSDPTTYEIPLEQLIERDPQVIIVGVNAFYKPTAAEIAEAQRLERPDGGEERRHPSRQRHRDHPARSAPGHRAAQPDARDVPRHHAAAGAVTRR